MLGKARLTIVAASKLIAERKLSATELVELHLAQIEALNPRLHAFLLVAGDQAVSRARQADAEIAAGGYRGQLHGIPVSLKDLYYTRGIRTTAGSELLRTFTPTYDATVWRRMKRAGAVLLGKTNMYEFARGATATKGNALMPAARNPWDESRIPGGSSDGSAVAVATDMGLASMGSDTAGSVRIPAALCGIVGLRPTMGLISRHGTVPLSPTLDTCGPMTRSVEDCRIVTQVVAGYDARDAQSARRTRGRPIPRRPNHRPFRIGVISQFSAGLHPEVARAFKGAMSLLEHGGMEVLDTSIPALRDGAAASKAIFLHEAAASHEATLRASPQLYSPPIRRSFEEGATITAAEIAAAEDVCQSISIACRRALREVDVLVSPTVPVPAPRFSDLESADESRTNTAEALDDIAKFTRPLSLSGLPSLTIPCGFANEELPIGLQLVGRPFDEETLFAVATVYQESTNWHEHVVPVAI